MKRLVCFIRGHVWRETYRLQRPWEFAGWICMRCLRYRDAVEVLQ